MLFILITLVMGISAHVKSSDEIISIRIGMFNSLMQAQHFFESVPPLMRQEIRRDQLWVNAYQTPSGFNEHNLEISHLSSLQSEELCDYVRQNHMQCFITSKDYLPASLFNIQKTEQQAPMDKMDAPAIAPTQHTKLARIVHTEENPLVLKIFGKPLERQIEEEFEEIPISDTGYNIVPDRYSNSYDQHYDTILKQAHQAEQYIIETPPKNAEYDEAHKRFIDALRNVGNGMNTGEGEETLRAELLTLGRDLFKDAGGAYLTSFLNSKVKHGEIITAQAEEQGSGARFIGHVQNNLDKALRATIDSLIEDLMFVGTKTDILDDAILMTTADNFMISGAKGLIDSGLALARQSDLYALRHMELEYNLNNFENSYFSALLTQPIHQSADLRHNIFLQGGGIVNEQSVDIDDDENRHTINVGAAYRYLTEDEKYLLGANIFYDHQFPYNHARMSLGIDAKAKDLNFAANYYYPLSDFKDSRIDSAGRKYEERALEGYDIELGYTFSYLPELSIFGKGYTYFRETDDDIRGLELSAEYSVNDNFVVRGALIDENGGRDGSELAFQYRMPLYDPQDPNLVLEDIRSASGNDSMRSRIFEKVRRENRIRVEERLKVDDTVIVSAQFDATSIGLPFIVGGAATPSGVNLPFNTVITVPNGDFSIINFSNGAIANISASGGGDVILEFSNTTLTVTATNGGFVQFISGSGGIRTVNVPGGMVNLIGTDIDITDDGTTTTIQVRAGQVNVVPDVGVATLGGNQSDVVSLTIASGVTSLLVNPALETRQEEAFTNLDLINPNPPIGSEAAPFINVTPALITGPQFIGNNADVRLTFTQPVTVAGAPFINSLVGANPRSFAYNVGASTPTQLVFRHVFIAADVGSTSLTIQDLDLNGGTIIGTTNSLDAVTAYTDVTLPINDTTPPSLTLSSPVDNDPAFASASDIVLTFNETIQAGLGNIFITDTTDGTDNRIIPIGDAQISIVGSTLTLNPTTNLELSTDYDVTIASGVIEDVNSNDFAGITSGNLNFTTSNDTTPPLFTGANIADGATQIARNANIVLNFDENIAVIGTITLTDTDDGSSTVSYTLASPEVTVSGTMITLNPSTDLEYAENYEITWPLGAIQDLNSNNAAALTSTDLNFETVNLERTLTLTRNITAPDGNVDEANVQGSGVTIPTAGTYVMALDLTIPVSPSGLIFECGGAGQGQFVGFNAIDNVFRIRGGEGGNATPDTDLAFLDVPTASFIAGSYTLTFEYDFTLRRVRAWLDENLLGSGTSPAALEGNRWSGGDNCAFFTNAQGSLTVGEPSTAFNGTLLSTGFRYYTGQTVP